MRFGDVDGLGTYYDSRGNLILEDDEELWMAMIPNGWFLANVPLNLVRNRPVYLSQSMGIQGTGHAEKDLSDIDKSLVPFLDGEHQAVDQMFWNPFPTPILVTDRRIVRLRCTTPSKRLFLMRHAGVAAEQRIFYYYEKAVRDHRGRVFGEIRWDEILRMIVADYGAALIIKPGTQIQATLGWKSIIDRSPPGHDREIRSTLGSDSWIKLGVRYPKQLFQLKTFLRIARTLHVPISFSPTGRSRWHKFHSMFHFEDQPVETGLMTPKGEPHLMAGERELRHYKAKAFVYWLRQTGGSLWRKHEFLPPQWFHVIETTQRFILVRGLSEKDTRYKAFDEDDWLFISFDKTSLKTKDRNGIVHLKLKLDRRNRVEARLVRRPSLTDIQRHEAKQKRLRLWTDRVAEKYRQPVGATKGFSEIPFEGLTGNLF